MNGFTRPNFWETTKTLGAIIVDVVTGHLASKIVPKFKALRVVRLGPAVLEAGALFRKAATRKPLHK